MFAFWVLNLQNGSDVILRKVCWLVLVNLVQFISEATINGIYGHLYRFLLQCWVWGLPIGTSDILAHKVWNGECVWQNSQRLKKKIELQLGDTFTWVVIFLEAIHREAST